MVVEIKHGKETSLQEAIDIAEVLEEDVFNLLVNMDEYDLQEWAYAWQQRIREEMRRRIETGFVTPFKYLKWSDFGRDERFAMPDSIPWP